MTTFTLAISCLTTSNLPWFMDLTFQVPMQYCSLQHRTSLPSPVTSTTGCCIYFGSISSFFLELFLHSSPVVHWAPTNLAGLLGGRSSLVAQLVKNLPQCRRPGFDPCVGKIPWRRERLPTPVSWPGEFHGVTWMWEIHGVTKSRNLTEWLSLLLNEPIHFFLQIAGYFFLS